MNFILSFPIFFWDVLHFRGPCPLYGYDLWSPSPSFTHSSLCVCVPGFPFSSPQLHLHLPLFIHAFTPLYYFPFVCDSSWLVTHNCAGSSAAQCLVTADSINKHVHHVPKLTSPCPFLPSTKFNHL